MKPSVLLVSLDTLRADVAFSGKFPVLERLRREGASFRRVVAPSPLTPVSHASVMTGLQPPRHGIRHLLQEQLRPGTPTLAQILKDEGYATAAVVSCPGLNQWYGLNQGFAHYDDEIPRLADGRDPLHVADVKLRGTALKRAPVVIERALEWLRKRPVEPFFLFVHFFDSHWPYEAPEAFGNGIANAYEGEVAYMAHYLDVLLQEMEGLGYALDDMIVAGFSDHGEDLGGWYPNDHAGERGHPEEEGHGCLLFDATQLVPLWIRAPGRVPSGLDVSSQVRLIDLAPTILDLLGVAGPSMDGRSLVPDFGTDQPSHRPGYSETYFPEERARADHQYPHLKPLKAVRLEDRYKVIWEVGGDRVELYDLLADPHERNPLLIGHDALGSLTSS